MKVKFLLLAAIMVTATFAASAQSDSTIKAQRIDELFKLLNMEDAYKVSIQQTVEQTISQNAKLADKKEAVSAFFTKYMGFAAVKDNLAGSYARNYSASELEDLIKFYKTPAGKKFNTASAAIANEAFMISNANLQLHQHELVAIANGK
jgi:hypothetical protein